MVPNKDFGQLIQSKAILTQKLEILRQRLCQRQIHIPDKVKRVRLQLRQHIKIGESIRLKNKNAYRTMKNALQSIL